MTRLTRTELVRSLEKKRLDVDDLSGPLREIAKKSDLDASGDVQGSAEVNRLFDGIDAFDSNGDRDSIRTRSGNTLTEAGALADQAMREAVPDARQTMTLSSLQLAVRGKALPLSDVPAEVRAVLAGADQNQDGKIAGMREVAEGWRRVDALDANGDRNSILAVTPDGAATEAGKVAQAWVQEARADASLAGAVPSVVSWSVPASTVARAESSSLGRTLLDEVPYHADVYREAASLTGVPAQLIAAIHGNESQFGTYRASTHGPESGFGLDDRFVTTSWANEKLRGYGLGAWERGRDTPKGRLQSAVVAAEHLKRMASYVGVTVRGGMNAKEIAGAVTAYTTGVNAGERAYRDGRSWMFDPSDPNPHPRHPGGTSRTASGTISVAASRKESLLRWDTLVPLIEDSLS